MFKKSFHLTDGTVIDIQAGLRWAISDFSHVPYWCVKDYLFFQNHNDYERVQVQVVIDMVSEGHSVTITADGRADVFPLPLEKALMVFKNATLYQSNLGSNIN